jgi:BlaR1 peptidase M56
MLTYFLLTNLSISLLYAVYWLFLRRETFSRPNRFYLLGAVIISLVIPAVEFPEIVEETIGSQVVSVVPEIPILQENTLKTSQKETINAGIEKSEKSTELSYFQLPYFQLVNSFWKPALLVVYLAGVLLFFIQFLKDSWKLYQLIAKHKKEKKENYFLIEYEGNYGIFSFFNYLFWSKQVPYNELIVKHELAHIMQKHSFDLLFFEILAVVFWCNPVIRFYQKSVRLIHEYLADEAVAAQAISKTDYAQTLLAYSMQTPNLQFAHHFSYPQTLKQRIMKIYQEKSDTKARLKYLFAIPALLLCLFVVACEKQTFQAQEAATSTEKSEISTYIPVDFQAKIKALQAEHPNKRFSFSTRESKFLQRQLDDSEEGIAYWEKIMYYRPISPVEDAKYMEGQFAEYLQTLIDKHGEISLPVILHKKMMKQPNYDKEMTGFLYMLAISESEDDDSWQDEDVTVYTEVDELPKPRDGAAFYDQIAQLIKLPVGTKADDLEGDMVLEMVVTKQGQITKANIVEEIAVKSSRIFSFGQKNMPPNPDAVNGAVFRAFTERSEVRGWKVGIKNGKRVDTKIRFRIPLNVVQERC